MSLPRIAIATGDPAGIGPEIALKAALDARVTALCRPLLVGDPAAVELHAKAAGLRRASMSSPKPATPTGRTARSICSTAGEGTNTPVTFGKVDAAYGRASLASARRAIKAALAGEVEAVVAAPQTERSIHAAGIAFDGYPSFVARETGTPVNDVYLMICFDDVRIAHATLHVSVREAVALITRERVERVIRVVDTALKSLASRSRRFSSAGSIRMPAKKACSARKKSTSSFRPSRARPKTASRPPARSAPTPCSARKAATPIS